MQNYRISKFDPQKRNANGMNPTDEWEAIIEKNPNNTPTYDEYIKVENAYIEAINLILSKNNTVCLTIDCLENYYNLERFEEDQTKGRLKNLPITFKDIMDLHNGIILNLDRIDIISRLILREVVWMDLVSKTVRIVFGYDYLMFVKCPKLTDDLIDEIQAKRLYVEHWESDRIFIREN